MDLVSMRNLLFLYTLVVFDHLVFFPMFCHSVIIIIIITSCAGGRHNMPRPLQVDL